MSEDLELPVASTSAPPPMALEVEYRRLRNKVQSILKTGTQAWGEASTFAEMNINATTEILDVFFPPGEKQEGAEHVVLDIGSGLGNFPFRAALRNRVKAIGIEFNRECHLQTVQLLQVSLCEQSSRA